MEGCGSAKNYISNDTNYKLDVWFPSCLPQLIWWVFCLKHPFFDKISNLCPTFKLTIDRIFWELFCQVEEEVHRCRSWFIEFFFTQCNFEWISKKIDMYMSCLLCKAYVHEVFFSFFSCGQMSPRVEYRRKWSWNSF